MCYVCNKNKLQIIMTNFYSYYCLFSLLFFIINTRETDDERIHDSEFNDDSGSDNDLFENELNVDESVCVLPIDEGDCRDRSSSTDEDSNNDYSTSDSNELSELNKLEGLQELNELNELGGGDEDSEQNTLFYGYNKSTKKCEQFNYDGCGGNNNRFVSIDQCRKTCYSFLSYFLAKVQDRLFIRIANSSLVG